MLRAVWIGGLVVGAWLGAATAADALEPPPDLPRYDLAIRIDAQNHLVRLKERVTWTNRAKTNAAELVFNVYPRYQLPDKDLPIVAKTVELLRESPAVALDAVGHCGDVDRVVYLGKPVKGANPTMPALPQTVALPNMAGPEAAGLPSDPLPMHWRTDIDSALVVSLPEAVAPGESVVVEIDYSLKLPDKQGRWGVYDGVTTLNHWMPTLAVHDDAGWQPTPFVPWHQPFFLEAGVYKAKIALPAGQKLACSGHIIATNDLPEGWVQYETAACVFRDFSILASARYEEHVGEIDGIALRVLALPEHAFFAQEMVRIAAEAIPAYSRWFGPFPYRHFTIAEGFFPWNGNECGALVMIDHRVFQMPHMGRGYVDYLVSHEILHQWWYNAVGTNGFSETWMDEGVATYFSHRLLNLKNGKNNTLLEYPAGFRWMPNIHRENYRWSARAGSIRRGDMVPAVAPNMQEFGSVVGLFSGAYDRGSRLIGMIEERLGETATFDFFQLIYKKYYFRILRVADFQRELEAYTGRSWDDYFKNWVYGKGITDWKIEKVSIEPRTDGTNSSESSIAFLLPFSALRPPPPNGYTVSVVLHQRAQIDEPTSLGFQVGTDDKYQVRVPVVPSIQRLTVADPPAVIETLPDHRVRVTVQLHDEPKQIAVDPDQVLEDAEPANNFWKPRERWRWTPLYTQLEESDLMNDYDRWNFIVGPWLYATASCDPWFQRSSYAGARIGAYRTQQYSGGVYAALRGDYRDLVVGADGLIDHWPWPKTQVGYLVEQRIAGPFGTDARDSVFRGALYGRYIFQYTSAMYLNPMHYAEVFGTYQDNPLPFSRTPAPGAERPNNLAGGGLHYHKDYLTPYWDPEVGYCIDATYMAGATNLPDRHDAPFHKLESQVSMVQGVPDGLGWLSETRLAARAAAAAGAFPDEGQFFALGGSQLFRGFDLAERQGSFLWVTSLEWRAPIVRGINWDVADHVAGLRSIWLVGLYDAGAVYANGHVVENIAHALGAGLRFDVAWFSFIERTVVRFDAAKTVNADSPWQFWLGIQHAF